MTTSRNKRRSPSRENQYDAGKIRVRIQIKFLSYFFINIFWKILLFQISCSENMWDISGQSRFLYPYRKKRDWLTKALTKGKKWDVKVLWIPTSDLRKRYKVHQLILSKWPTRPCVKRRGVIQIIFYTYFSYRSREKNGHATCASTK